MLVLSGLATGLSWLCYYRALQLGPASKVAPVDKLSVALVIIFAALFLERIPDLESGAGRGFGYCGRRFDGALNQALTSFGPRLT